MNEADLNPSDNTPVRTFYNWTLDFGPIDLELNSLYWFEVENDLDGGGSFTSEEFYITPAIQGNGSTTPPTVGKLPLDSSCVIFQKFDSHQIFADHHDLI